MTLETRTTTNAAAERVWAVLADLDAWPDWLPTVDSLEREDPDRPHEVGAAYLVKQPRLPKARWVITDWRAGKGFVWESKTPGARTTGTHRLRSTSDGGTEILLGVEWTGPLAGVARLMFGRLTQRYIETEAAALAERAAT